MSLRRPRSWALLLLLGFPSALLAGWSSLGAMPPPQRQEGALLFRNDQGTVVVSVLSPEIVRVRFAPAQVLGRDHSYAIVNRDFGDPGASFRVADDRSLITTRSLTVDIRHAPFRLAITDARGEVRDRDDLDRGIAFAGASGAGVQATAGRRPRLRLRREGRSPRQAWLGSWAASATRCGTATPTATTAAPTPSMPRCRSSWCCATAAPTASSSTTPTAASSTWAS